MFNRPSCNDLALTNRLPNIIIMRNTANPPRPHQTSQPSEALLLHQAMIVEEWMGDHGLGTGGSKGIDILFGEGRVLHPKSLVPEGKPMPALPLSFIRIVDTNYTGLNPQSDPIFRRKKDTVMGIFGDKLPKTIDPRLLLGPIPSLIRGFAFECLQQHGDGHDYNKGPTAGSRIPRHESVRPPKCSLIFNIRPNTDPLALLRCIMTSAYNQRFAASIALAFFYVPQAPRNPARDGWTLALIYKHGMQCESLDVSHLTRFTNDESPPDIRHLPAPGYDEIAAVIEGYPINNLQKTLTEYRLSLLELDVEDIPPTTHTATKWPLPVDPATRQFSLYSNSPQSASDITSDSTSMETATSPSVTDILREIQAQVFQQQNLTSFQTQLLLQQSRSTAMHLRQLYADQLSDKETALHNLLLTQPVTSPEALAATLAIDRLTRSIADMDIQTQINQSFLTPGTADPPPTSTNIAHVGHNS